MGIPGREDGSAVTGRGRSGGGVSIRARLAWLVILVALPISAERVFSLLAERQRQVDATMVHLRETAQAVSLAQRENIASALAITQTLARQATSLMSDDAGCGRLLRQISNDMLGVLGIWIGTPDGRIRCASSRAMLGADLSDRAYVQGALRTHRPVVSDFVVSKNTARNLIVVAEAQRNSNGDPEGLVAVGLDLQWMSRLASQAGSEAGVTVLVVDGEGHVLARYPPIDGLVGQLLRDHPLVRGALAADEGTLEGEGFDGVTRYYSFVRMPDTAVRVLVGIDQAEAVGAIDRRIFTVLAVLAASVAFLVCFALYAADRMIVEPVQQLARDMLAVGRDDGASVRDVGFQEFRPVVQAFSEMHRQLRERAAELRRLNGRLTALANTDALTGLANRRTFDVHFSGEWLQAADRRRPLGLVILDVDDFKLFNDTMGHLAGDKALRDVARMLAAAVAGTPNLAARYGGEEFAVILPDTDTQGAVEFAEDVRRLVTALGIGHSKAPAGRLTASFGAASTIPGPDMSPDALLAAADAALYEAKRLGRNRVVGARDKDAPVSSAQESGA